MDPEIEAALAALTDATVGTRARVAVGNAAQRTPPRQFPKATSVSLSSLASFAEAGDPDPGSDRGIATDRARSSEEDPMKRLQQVRIVLEHKSRGGGVSVKW